MSEDTPENEGEDADVEAEMLRMMQEEIGEGGDEAGAEGGDAGADEAGGDNAEGLLEEEMRRAMEMEDESPDSALASFGGGGVPTTAQQPAEGIERLSDVDITVTVELGGNLIPIRDILTWTSGSTVELEPQENDPVDVLVNGKLFAHGEIVVVGDTFGVRILELIDPD